MSFELTGKLHLKEAIQDVSASFKKRDFVIEVPNEKNQEWNDFVRFQLTQDRCSAIEPMQVGQQVKVSFNIRGRKWEKDGKVSYFNSLEAWRLESVSGSSSAASEPPTQFQQTQMPAAEAEDDLPF